MACLSLKQLLQWAKLLTLPAKSLIALASPKWCANLSPNELLQRQARVSLTPFAYERRH
jgi:hypothetical protein